MWLRWLHTPLRGNQQPPPLEPEVHGEGRQVDGTPPDCTAAELTQ
jgi:hypothetical protein